MARPIFEDLPSTNTPINAANLNKVSEGTINVGSSVDNSYITNIVKGNNLFDASNIIAGKYVDNITGAIYTSANRVSSGYIQVEPSTDYIISNVSDLSTNGKGMAYYNENKEFISGAILSNLTGGKFTTPANCKYIYFSYDIASTQFSSIMLNEGTTALPYEAYKRSIVVDGEEIYSKDNIEQYSLGEIRIGTWIDGKPLYRKVVKTVMGTCTTNGTYGTSNRYTVAANAEIKNFYGIIPLGGGIFPILYVDSGGRFTKVASDDGKTLILSTNAVFFSGADCEITVEYTKSTD